MPIITKKFILVAFIILFPSILWGACTGSSPTWETTPDEASVDACLSGASAGDTINVTAGDGDEDWTSIYITSSKPVKLIGPGASNLNINVQSNGTVFTDAYEGTIDGANNIRISGFKFTAPAADKTAIWMAGTYWRVDNCTFVGFSGQTSGSTMTMVLARTILTVVPIGLIDNNTFTNSKVYVQGSGTFSRMGTKWAENISIGQVGTVFVEDNVFTNSLGGSHQFIDQQLASKYVARYNTITGNWGMAHGLQFNGDFRGSKEWEIYGNNFISDDAGNQLGLGFYSGTGVVFINKGTGTVALTINLGHYRTSTSYTGSGICDGTSQWDGNETGQAGWPCRDQIGTGYDASAWSDSSSLPGPTQTKLPAYLWSNIDDGSSVTPTAQAPHVQANRDYYNYNASFDGTSGVGCGTLAARPATCTTGVGYWATAQSCSDLTGMVGASAATPISGTLYKCTATNTWTAYYTPYAYPHPLRNETSDQTLTLTVEGSGACTVTSFPAGISSTSSTTQDFEQNTEVTMTVSATSPNYFSGWSGTGGCTGAGSCVMTMSEAKAATATCSRYGVGTIGAGGQITFGAGGSITLQ